MEQQTTDDNNTLNNTDIVTDDILDGLGISQPAFQEIGYIVGHRPTVHELGTLLAMWKAQGTRQGLLSWLKGQPHVASPHDYLENDLEPQSKEIPEPRVRECIDIAVNIFPGNSYSSDNAIGIHRGDAIYMVGDVSLYFSHSEYARRHLHLVADPIVMDNEDETSNFLSLILDSLLAGNIIFANRRISKGGLFGTLLECVAPQRLGFDILTCREVRLDSFLFGESGVRHIVFLEEKNEDFFLQKLTEARVNCCFLGRVTKGRLLVDDMDFGPVSRYCTPKQQ